MTSTGVTDPAPVSEGYVADIGYAGCLGPNRIFEQLIGDLSEYRTLPHVRRWQRMAAA